MNKKSLQKNFILSAAAAVLLWGIVALVFDYYYDLNDDILIKDIISGIYTGAPEAHNNQMMYPLSLLFCGLYKAFPAIPWFGLTEIICFITSFIIILRRMLNYLNVFWQKGLFAAVFTFVFASLYIWEIVMLQYTVVAGLLCAAAAVIVYTHEAEETPEKTGRYIKAVTPAIVLLFFAFNFRSEMFLLMCPFMAAAGLAKWAKEPAKNSEENTDYKGIFDIANIKKYFSLIGIIFALILLTAVIDSLAYSGSEWKEFRRFFDARTDVYDFTGIPDYDANIEFYESQGISPEQYALLINYNFAIDERIDSEMLESIAEYAKSGNAINSNGTAYARTTKSIKTSIGEYVRNITSIDIKRDYDSTSPFAEEGNQFSPFGMLVLLLYVAVFVAAFYGKKGYLYLSIIALALFRSIAWIYVFHMGRIVPRITHPMYLIEMFILLAILLDEFKISVEEVREKGKTGLSGPEITVTFSYIVVLLAVMVCAGCIGSRWAEVKEKSSLRENLNGQAKELNCHLAVENKYYYLDVYSTVEWTEKIFESQLSKKNQQLAGGWMAFSPLDRSKQESYPADFYFVTFENEEELNWIQDWNYMKTGTADTEIELADTVDGKKGQLNIYKIYQQTN